MRFAATSGSWLAIVVAGAARLGSAAQDDFASGEDVESVHDGGVGASAAVDVVDGAVDGVVNRAGDDQVLAAVGTDQVGAVAAEQFIVAAVALEPVVALSAGQAVRAAQAGDVVVPAQAPIRSPAVVPLRRLARLVPVIGLVAVWRVPTPAVVSRRLLSAIRLGPFGTYQQAIDACVFSNLTIQILQPVANHFVS